MLALLCSGVAWASLPRVVAMPISHQTQWQALGVAPLSNGGTSGMRILGIEVLPPPEVEQAGFEAALLLGQRAATGRQLQIVQPELVDRRGPFIH